MRSKNGWFINCKTCKKEIYINPSSSTKKYCSKKCAGKSEKKRIASINNLKSINNQRVNNPRYKDGRWTYRKYTLLENENICKICKSKEKLLVHHIDNNRSNNIKKNLIILCYSCHGLIHKLSYKTQKQVNNILKYSKQLK